MGSSLGRETESGDGGAGRHSNLVTLEQSLQEKDTPRKKGVVRLEGSDPKKNHQQHRRDQNGIHHGQPLPEHVHEDGHDHPRLEQHEHDDEEPPQVALKVEIVDQIGCRAENEQQSPDLEINTDRMLLPLHMCRDRLLLSPCVCVCHGFLLPKIEDCEYEYPNQVDE